jgi:hypothetical protein
LSRPIAVSRYFSLTHESAILDFKPNFSKQPLTQFLLDTHAVLWWLGATERLDIRAKSVIGNPRHIVYFSAAVMFEIATKEANGTLRVGGTSASASRPAGSSHSR